MAGPRRLVFRATSDAINRMTELFDFVWPTAVALANMRSQAGKLQHLSVSEQENALRALFSVKDFPRAALAPGWIGVKWDAQHSHFAQITLTNVFAIYEGWIDDFVDTLDAPNHTRLGGRKKFSNSLQFWAHQNGDWSFAMSQLQSLGSSDMELSFGKDLSKSDVVANANPENLLKCYRYFKEIRNALMHRNGLATKRLVDAQADYIPVANAPSLNVRKAPEDPNPLLAEGDPVSLSLYGVAGFNDICRQLMILADYAAGMTILGEEAMCKTLAAASVQRSKSGHLKSRLGRMASHIGLRIDDYQAFERILNSRGVVIP